MVTAEAGSSRVCRMAELPPQRKGSEAGRPQPRTERAQSTVPAPMPLENWNKRRKGQLHARGDRAADVLRDRLGSWGFVIGFIAFMAVWVILNTLAIAWDPYPFILLNLFLSMLAGLQGAILLIAAKRSDAVAAALAEHDYKTNVASKHDIDELLKLQQAAARADRSAERPAEATDRDGHPEDLPRAAGASLAGRDRAVRGDRAVPPAAGLVLPDSALRHQRDLRRAAPGAHRAQPAPAQSEATWSRALSVSIAVVLLAANQVALVAAALSARHRRPLGRARHPARRRAGLGDERDRVLARLLGARSRRARSCADARRRRISRRPTSGSRRTTTTTSWLPEYFDYLYFSATNSMAFSPTDAMPRHASREGVHARRVDRAASRSSRW